MAVEVVGRGRKFTVERDPTWEPGRYRLTTTIHDQHYHDATAWQPVGLLPSRPAGLAAGLPG